MLDGVGGKQVISDQTNSRPDGDNNCLLYCFYFEEEGNFTQEDVHGRGRDVILIQCNLCKHLNRKRSGLLSQTRFFKLIPSISPFLLQTSDIGVLENKNWPSKSCPLIHVKLNLYRHNPRKIDFFCFSHLREDVCSCVSQTSGQCGDQDASLGKF